MFFLCSMVVSYRCCPFAWTDNVTCLRNMLQDYVIPSSYCRRVLGTKLITHWFCRLFQIPQHDLILWVSPRHGQFLGSHCVETFIDTSAADSSKCAVGVVRTQLGHSGLHAKQKVMGLSGNDIIQHLIPMEFQLMTKLDLWDGGHKPFAAAPWTVDRTFFLSVRYRLFGQLCTCRGVNQEVSHDVWRLFPWKKMKSNGVWGSISCLLITNCHNWPNHQKPNFYRGDKNGVCQFSDFYRHDKKMIQKY